MLGQDFCPGVCVCLQAPSDDGYPEFARVMNVFVPDESKLLLVRMLATESYSPHKNAYCITKTSDYSIVKIDELAIHEVFTLYTLSSGSYMVIRSYCHTEIFV